MNNYNSSVISEIRNIETYIRRRKLLEKEMEENPDNVVNYYKKYPFLFSAIYLAHRKYDIVKKFYHSFDIVCSPFDVEGYALGQDISKCICKYFYNVDIHTEEKLDDELYIERLESYAGKVYNEIRNLIMNNIFISHNYSYEQDSEDYTVEVLQIFLDIDFRQLFLVPIIKGEYDEELEKICKKLLLKLSLENSKF